MSTMAEQTPSKRQREETQSSDHDHGEETKRHKSYNRILSLLEAEEDEPTQDLSSFITTLQQELSSDSVLDGPLPCPTTTTTTLEGDLENPTTATTMAAATNDSSILEDYTSATSSLKEDEDQQDDKERVIRHLLEASDDELGIPNREDGVGVEVVEFEDGFDNGGSGLTLCDRLWELEDEAANYYTLLQSELFM